MRICFRCGGRKKLYKVGAGYSYTNSGGALVQCPLCQGTGLIKTLDEAVELIKSEPTKGPSDASPKKAKPATKKIPSSKRSGAPKAPKKNKSK